METTNGMHYSVRDDRGNRFACYAYPEMAVQVAVRQSKEPGSRPMHVEHVRDCDCKHGAAS